MPPKPKKTEPAKKTQEKKKEKLIEDKTFGLKNKKGGKQQKFIKTVTQQVKYGNQKTSKMDELSKAEREKKKEEKKKEQDELNQLFRPVQIVSKGADPKSVLCAFFKQGQCSKGAKCKFSHDLTLDRKSEKRNVYSDSREEDTMENWDETKLEEVVAKKHGEAEKSKPKTAIICKYFLEAVEGSKYGWFWECPNGTSCHYRHCLPPGFVLKKDQKKTEKEDEISIEELVETERAALGINVTKVTLETFLAWKERKKKEKIDAAKKQMDKKKSDFKSGKVLGISGREMFEFNPDLVAQDDDEATEETIVREDIDEDVEETVTEVRDINLDSLAALAQEVDGTGTVSTSSARKGATSETTAEKSAHPGCGDNEDGKLDLAGALPVTQHNDNISQTDAAIAAAMAATVNGEELEIDEDLFGGEDIDLVEEDLETLELDDD